MSTSRTTTSAATAVAAAVAAVVAAATATPEMARAGPTVESLSGGDEFTCAVLSDSSVRCAGLNSYGNLGNGNTANQDTPQVVTGLKASSVSCGMTHACAVELDGAVACWGSTSSGETGTDPNLYAADGFTATPVTVGSSSGMPKVTSLCAGMYFTLAVGEDGSVWGWGSNLYGVLGRDGTAQGYGGYSYVPAKLAGFQDEKVAEVACGQIHACFLSTSGGVACQGMNTFGQIPSAAFGVSNSPVWVSGVTAQSVAAGAWHTCVVATAGALQCSGSSTSGQSGAPTGTRTSLAAVTGFESGVESVIAGNSFNVVSMSDGSTKFFGQSTNGEAGTGSTKDVLAPGVAFAGGALVRVAGAGSTHVVFVDAEGKAWGTGVAAQGELATGALDAAQAKDPAPSLFAGAGEGAPTPAPTVEARRGKTKRPTKRPTKRHDKDKRHRALRG